MLGAKLASMLSFHFFPIPDRGIPAPRAAAISAIGKIAGQLDGGRNVAIHCRQGIGRSGLIAVAVLVRVRDEPSGIDADCEFRTRCLRSRNAGPATLAGRAIYLRRRTNESGLESVA